MNIKIKKQIKEKLKEVIDPELGISVVDLGLIYEINLKNNEVNIKMTLTFPGCPLKEILVKEIEKKILEIPSIKKVNIDFVFDPPWTPERISKKVRKKLGI